jgi:hypothetical protein
VALAKYLEEVERLAGDKRFAAALDVLETARTSGASDPDLNIRMTRLRDTIEGSALHQIGEQALGRGDNEKAIEVAGKLLERDPDDEVAMKLLTAANKASEPAEEAETPQQRRERGKLTVMSSEVGTVFVDDRPVGRTPLRGFDIAAGRHTVEVRRAGYATERSRVTVRASRLSRVSVDLKREDKPAPQPDPAVVATPKPAPTPAPDPVSAVVVTKPKPTPEPTPAPVEPKPTVENKPKPASNEIPAPRLPASHSVKSPKEIARVLSIIEQEAMKRGGAPASVAKGSTRPLAQGLFDKWSPGMTLTIKPREMYYTIVKGARAGQSQGSVAATIKRTQL